LDHSNNVAITDAAEMRWGDGFEIETLINIRAAGASLQVVEVPSVEHRRLYGRSNLHAFSDGLRVFRTIFVEWRSRYVSDTEADGNMGTILDFSVPHLDRETLFTAGSELEYLEVANRSS
jgi:hypothetical protein